MKIGILTAGHIPPELSGRHGTYSDMYRDMLSGRGFTFENWNVVDMVFPAGIHDADAWLISGSRHGAYEDLPWIEPLKAFIREAYAAEVPLIGICFGHQIMAQALGGKVVKFPGGWGLGYVRYGTQHGELGLFALHQDQVIDLPDEARVIASNDFCKYAGLVYPGTNAPKAISFQPHPEFSARYMRDLIEVRRGSAFSEEIAERALETMQDKTDAPRIADQIANFLHEARQSRAA